jgi:hypothetical protein
MVIWEVYPTDASWSRWFATRKDAMAYLRQGYPDIRRTRQNGDYTYFASEDKDYEDLAICRTELSAGRKGVIDFLNGREEQ